jgi:hypothetical protein
MPSSTGKSFIARTIYHHKQRTAAHVTLLVYKDRDENYELFDDSEADHEHRAGTRGYILDEWRRLNQQLIEDSFQRDDLRGEEEFQRFITG